MIKKHLVKLLLIISLGFAFGIITTQQLQAQVDGSQTIKWLWVSNLRQYFSSTGAEIEYGRRGRGPYLNTDQTDGLRWPALFSNTDHNVGKALWLGTTNFTDPSNNFTYPYKVIPLGRSALFTNQTGGASFPVDFKLIGRFPAPTVVVDGQVANDLAPGQGNDLGNGDEIDPALPVDREIYNTVNTPIGVTFARKVLASSQQYHNNYFIYEYVFKNTGFTDNLGGKITPVKTLTGVMFNFIYRTSDNFEGYEGPVTPHWAYAGVDYGLNQINDAVGQDATHTLPAPNDFCANFGYYGPASTSTGVLDDIGAPDYLDGHILGATGFTGELVLHADKSPQDTTNDPAQPTTVATVIGSDNSGADVEAITINTPFDPTGMAEQYQMMTQGRDTKTLAEIVGKDANGWPKGFGNGAGGNNPGGYQSMQGFGPYTLNPGDSVRIVLAEAVAGISREKNIEIAGKWYAGLNGGSIPPASLPPKDPTLPVGLWNPWNGGTTSNADTLKNAWVFTARDSLFQTFRRARDNYNSHYNIPQPPPPPSSFTVTSGGDRISLQWSNSAESWPNFNGYQIYRMETTNQTTNAVPIFSCNKSNVVNSFDDITANRGFNYFYYIQTKDDGTTNNIEPGVPLVSSMFYTLTNTAATLQRPAANALEAIRVVPNPYNIRATALQFGTDKSVANRLAFYGLPKYCMIKIFTEVGDLIQTINHTNGSGDELWNSKTSSGQIVASGLYIAYFEVTQDISGTNLHKGDSIFRKFIIIR